MKKILISVLGLMFSAAAFSQIITRPNPGTLGVGYARVVPDSTLYYPSGCGIPSNTARIGLHTAKGEIVKMGALYRDTCGHQTYSWDPALNSGAGGWDSVGKAGGGAGGASARLGRTSTATDIVITDTSTNKSITILPADSNTNTAGGLTALMAKQLLRQQKFYSAAEMRAFNNVDASAFYDAKIFGQNRRFKWNPTSTLADDSVMTIKVTSITTGRFEADYSDQILVDWFIPPGATDVVTYFEKATNYIMNIASKQSPILQLGGKDYNFSRTWFIGNFYSGSYHFFSIHIRGVANYIYSGYATRLIFAQKNAPGINFQASKGCELEKVEILGAANLPTDAQSLFTGTFSTFNDATCINNQFGVYAGVTLEAVGNNGMPSGGYTALSSKYTSTGAGSGSTGFYMHDFAISNFIVGFASSVNGSTQNAELTRLEDGRFSYTKVCIANGQDQEKSCVARHIQAWDNNFEFFNSGTYGAGSPGNWTLDDIDIAGAMNTFIMRPAGSYQAMHIENIYAESLVKFGIFNGGLVGSTAKNINVSFATHGETGVLPDYSIASDGVEWDGGHFRYYYGENTPVTIIGNSKFNNIYFDAPPYVLQYSNLSGGIPLFTNCKIGASNLPFNQSNVITTGVETVPAYGNFKLTSIANEQYGASEQWTITNTNRPNIETYTNGSAVVTVSAGHTFRFPVPPGEKYKFDSLGLVILHDGSDNNYVAGLCTQLNVQTDSITVSYVPFTVPNGTYNLGGSHALYFPGTFIGNTTNGSNVVTGIVMDYGYITSLPGNWIPIPGSTTGGTYHTQDNYQKVLSYSGNTITLSQGIGFTATGVSFLNYSKKNVETRGVYNFNNFNSLSNAPLLSQTTFSDAAGGNYEIIQGGFNAASADSRKAIYMQKNPYNGYMSVPKLYVDNSFYMVSGTPAAGNVLTDLAGDGHYTGQPASAIPNPYLDSLKLANGIVTSFLHQTGTAPTTLLYDNFNAANTGQIGGRTPSPISLSGGWIQVYGGVEIGISSNVAYSTSAGGPNYYYIAGVSGQHDVSLKFVNPAVPGGGLFALATNYSDQNNCVRVFANGSIQTVLGGAQIDFVAATATPVAGDVLHALVIGDTVYSFMNSTQVGKIYFDHTLYGTNVGVQYYNNATTTFDDFKLTDGNQLIQNWAITHDATLSGTGTPSDPLVVVGGGVSVPVVTSIVDSLFSTLTDSSLVKSFTSTDATPFNVDTILVSAGHSVNVEIDANNIRSDGNSSWFAVRRYHVISQSSGGLLVFSILDSQDMYSDNTVFSTATFSLKRLDNTHCIIETVGETSRTINQKYNIHFVSTN